MTDLTGVLSLEVEKARNDAFVWGVSTWSGYRWGSAADTAGGSREWLNVLGTTHDIKVRRGCKRDGVGVALEAGSLTATIFDSAVDPNTNPYVKPGTPLRLMCDGTPVFTGELDNVSVTYGANGLPTVVLTAVDRVKTLSNITRAGAVSGSLTERVDSLLTKHGIDWFVRDSNGTMLAQNNYESSLLNHLRLAADSADGGLVAMHAFDYVGVYARDSLYPFDPEAGDVIFTSERVQAGPAVTNLIKNPSFENGLTDWSYTTGAGLTTDSANVRSGTSAVALVIEASQSASWIDGIWTSRMPVVAGDVYTLSCWVYVEPAAGVVDATLSVLMMQYPTITGGTGTGNSHSVNVSPGTWQRVSLTRTVDSTSGAFMKSEIDVKRGNTPVGTEIHVFIDDVMLTEGATLYDYFDGDSDYAYWAADGTSVYDTSAAREYNDIVVRYDSDALVNELTINDLTYGVNDQGEPLSVETTYGPYRNETSIATFGAYASEVTTNLGDTGVIDAYAGDVLARAASPELRIDSVRWNATDDPYSVPFLDIGYATRVLFSQGDLNVAQTLRILAMEHTITCTPTEHKWMVDIDLIDMGDNA